VFNYLKGSYKEDRTRLFSDMHSKEKKRVVTVAIREIPVSYQEKLFTHTHTQTLYTLPTETVNSPSLKTVKAQLEKQMIYRQLEVTLNPVVL